MAEEAQLNPYSLKYVVEPSTYRQYTCGECDNLCNNPVEDSEGTLFCKVLSPNNLLVKTTLAPSQNMKYI